MDLSGEYSFEASPEQVFDAMIDPNVVAVCMPGCERLEPIGENRYRAVLSMGIAAITGRYEGTIELRDLNRPSSYVLAIDSRGKPGFVKGEGRLELTAAEGGGTTVKFSGKAQIGGTIARVGQRLVGGASKMMTDKFFACLASKLAGDSVS